MNKHELLIDTTGILFQYGNCNHLLEFYPGSLKAVVQDLLIGYVEARLRGQSDEYFEVGFLDHVLDRYYDSPGYRMRQHEHPNPMNEVTISVILTRVAPMVREIVEQNIDFFKRSPVDVLKSRWVGDIMMLEVDNTLYFQ